MLICKATAGDIDELDRMLRALSDDIQDRHLASIDALREAGFGRHPIYHAQIARDTQKRQAVGIALYSPVFSTVIGGAGLYVSDLWVAGSQRGSGLGSGLITAAYEDAAATWQAGFVKLAVYRDNRQARRFYQRLGFRAADSGDEYLFLKGEALNRLIKGH